MSSKNFVSQKNFKSERKFAVKKILGSKKFGSKKISPKKIKAPKKLGPKFFVKIGSVTTEIFLIWTNAAWTNVTVTFGICSRWSKVPTFKLWTKSGQYQLRYS